MASIRVFATGSGAADIFCSLSDSIQETFGLVIIEAMANGLPVVATDWDGYRDLVIDGTTGFLVPTAMVRSATADATVRLLLGIVDYDGFLAECNQAVSVEPGAVAKALTQLLCDLALRQRLGHAGRQRVLEQFRWQHIMRAYEALWRRQEEERVAHRARGMGHVPPAARASEGTARAGGLPCCPSPEVAFAGYPTHLLESEARVQTVAGVSLGQILPLPLCTYAGDRRIQDKETLELLLTAARGGTPLALWRDSWNAAAYLLAWLVRP